MVNRDGTVKKATNRLMSIKGNHDFVGKIKWNTEKTYFDNLAEQGLFAYPEAVLFTDTEQEYYYHFRSYGDGDKAFGKGYSRDKKVDVFAHDWFLGACLPEEYRYWEGFSKTAYNIEFVVSGVDAFIHGHSHSKYEPFKVIGLEDKKLEFPHKKEPMFYVTGTNARTPFTDSICRDGGYNLLIDSSKDLHISEWCLELKPYAEYFNMGYKNKRGVWSGFK